MKTRWQDIDDAINETTKKTTLSTDVNTVHAITNAVVVVVAVDWVEERTDLVQLGAECRAIETKKDWLTRRNDAVVVVVAVVFVVAAAVVVACSLHHLSRRCYC